MAEFDWGQYEEPESEFDWSQYETSAPVKASAEDKDKAFKMIKAKHPKMPEFVIRALLPLATKLAEAPKDTGSGTATGAFLRSAIRAPLEGAENLASLVGLPVNKDANWPEFIAESESDKSHPLAQIGGELAGFLAPGAGTIGALRSIPLWGKIAEKAAPSLLRRIPVYGAEGAALGAGFSPEGHRGEGALTGAALGTAASAIPSVGRGVMNLKERISSLRNLDRLKKEGQITQEEYQAAIHDEDALKALSKRQGIGSDVNQLESELPQLRQEAQQLGEDIHGIPEINTKNMLGAPTGEELVPEAESLLKNTEQEIAEHEKSIARKLGEGNAHRKRNAEILNPKLEKRQAKIGKGFNEYIEDLKDKKVLLSNPRDAKAITQDIKKAITEGGYNSKEVSKLAEELESLGNAKGETMPANKFVSAYRTLQSMANKTRSSAYGKTPQEFDRLIEAADSMDADVARMEEIIDQGLGEENLATLNKLKYRYATEVAPLFKNKFYQALRANNKAPANMMEQLTNEPYIRSTNPNKVTGTKILNKIIREDPELLKNVVGERFAHNPKEITQWDETANEFIQHMPELQEQIAHYKNLLAKKNMHTENVMRAKHKASEAKSEAERIKKSFSEEQKIQTERAKKVDELKSLHEKIAHYDRNIPELKKKAQAKNLSLQKKLELESKIATAEKDKEKLISRAITIGLAVGGSALTGMYFTHKFNANPY